MKKLLTAVAGATLLLAGTHSAFAATTTFNAATDLSIAADTSVDVTAAINATLNTNFGFTIDNGYLYNVSAYPAPIATGIANGIVATNNGSTFQTGRINFTTSINFVTFDFLAGAATPSTFRAFAADNTQLATFSAQGEFDTHTFNTGTTKSISYLTFDGPGGFTAINKMQYGTAPVPEPESLALVAAGLLTVGALARRRKA